ncbi:unnamed protein product [Tenebrio molitor]|nr:unnamed protein product [Tenebrio molitor]
MGRATKKRVLKFLMQDNRSAFGFDGFIGAHTCCVTLCSSTLRVVNKMTRTRSSELCFFFSSCVWLTRVGGESR